jgi:hypothetical protein
MSRAALLLVVSACTAESGATDAGPPDAAPVYTTCEGEPRTTAESLAGKASAYDARAMRLHVHPQMPWVLDVQLAPGADPLTAGAADVAAWRSGENDGLWSALYLASQAYRYAATRDAGARANLARLLDGERQRMRITGVPGLFTRQLIPPGVAGIACPTDPALYVPSTDKRSNRWVAIGADGCAQVADGSGTFTSTSHCGLDEFAGWCFLDNVSQDEYAGHVFALGAIAALADGAEQAAAVDLLAQIGAHLVANNMEFVDWDGRATQWGKLHPGAAGDAPGYLAILGMSVIATAAAATGDAALAAEHERQWLQWPVWFDQIDIWQGVEGCASNWNDLSMLVAAFHHAVWFEPDAARRAQLQDLWDAQVMDAPLARAAIRQKNAWFDIMWAARNPPAYAAVDDALCQLRQFPASNQDAARDTTALAPSACDGRSGESLASSPFDIADRCAATFTWWRNPYTRESCAADPARVEQPAGYLLPYWMARYHGFAPP